MFVAGLMTIMLLLIPGYAGWLAFGESLRERVTAVETVGLILIGSLVSVSWVAMLLAELGIFSLPLLLGLIGIVSLLLGMGGWKKNHLPNPFTHTSFQPVSLLILPIMLVAIWLIPPPFEYINGGRDHGLYINTGINIANTGRILIHDSALASIPTQSIPLLTNTEVSITPKLVPGPWSEGQRLPGMTIRDAEQGIIAPHAFHLYPVWVAVFYAIGGLQWALITSTILSMLGVIMVYLAGSKLFGQAVGLLASFLLVTSLAQVWYTRTPSSEILLQPLFWSGLFTFSLTLTTQNKYTAVLAGLSFGLMHLTKLDTVLIPVVLFIYFLHHWFKDRFRAADWAFIITYGIISFQAVLHAFFIATIYFLDQLTRVLLPDALANIIINAADGYTYPTVILRRLIQQNGLVIVLALGGTGLIIFMARHLRRPIQNGILFIERYRIWGRGLLTLGLISSVTFIYLIQSIAPQAVFAGPWQFLTFASWYLTSLGLFLGIIGMAQAISCEKQRNVALGFVGLMLFGNILPLVILGSGTYPDQFWAIRRFIPIVLPSFILFAAYTLWHLIPRSRINWTSGLLPIGLIGIIMWGQGQNLRPFLRFTDHAGMIDQTTEIAESFPENAVLLFEKSTATNRMTLPLWLIFNHTVFALEDGAIENPALLPAIEKWLADGRSVFWLGDGSTTPPLTNYDSRRTLTISLAESPAGRLPVEKGLFINTFDVHQITINTNASSMRRLITTIAIGQGDDGAAPAEGLHNKHKLPGLTSRRWTSGHVVLQIPASEELSEISMMIGNGRPADIPPADITVYLNDILLGTIHADGVNNTYNLIIPQQIEFTEETATLRLEMEPWTPAKTGHSLDQRELGVYLDWIKLIASPTQNEE